MRPDDLASALLNADESSYNALLQEAAPQPACREWLLDFSKRTMSEEPLEALRGAQIAHELAGLQNDRLAASSCSRMIGQCLRAVGRHQEAIDALQAAAREAQAAGDALLAVQVLVGAIDSLGWIGRHAEAVTMAGRMLSDLESLNAPSDAAKVHYNLGNVYYRQDRYHEALRCYELSAQTLSASGDPLAAARVDFNRANIYSELMQSDQALTLFRSAGEVFAQNNLPSISAMCDFNIGVLNHSLGMYSAALSAQQRALRYFTEHNQTLEVSKCNADMADVYRMLNLQAEALAAYDAAIERFVQIPLAYERARAELGRAAVLEARGMLSDAGSALQRAEAVFQLQKNATQLSRARLLRAYWLQQSGDAAAAGREAARTARAYARMRLPARAAEARFIEADIALSSGVDALRKMQAVARSARKHRLGWLEARAERAIGRYRARVGDAARGLRHLRAGVQALEAARTQIPGEDLNTAFVSDKLGVYEDIVALLINRGRDADLAEAMEYVERSRSRLLLERVQAALTTREGVTGSAAATAARVTELRARLNALYNLINPDDSEGSKRLIGSTAEHSIAVGRAEDEYREALLSAELEAGSALFGLMSVASPSDLQDGLLEDETLIEYYTVHGTICAFVLSKSGRVNVLQNIAERSEVERLARRLRYHLKRAGSAPDYVQDHREQFLSGVNLPLAMLYELLLKPVAPLIKGEQVSIIPHGALHGLPFHAFCNSETGQYALDQWEISYAPSATVRYLGNRGGERAGQESRPVKSLVMGVPHPGLEHITEEVAEVAALLPQSIKYCGPNATLERFYEHAESSRVIHLATHAQYRADNPLFSGLRFSDGWLLGRDLYSMRLRCDLVTLSACRTGQALVESGDEMFGLLRGFLAAGARAVAVSLWPAEDAPTACLMAKFHALMAQGQSRTAALRLAQQYVRRTWRHPYQWAAFALFGER